MHEGRKLTHVGAPDPERRNSPIVEETDEDLIGLTQALEEDARVCYLNDAAFAPEEYICSGSGELLQCRNGAWLRIGSCDPHNP